MSGNCFPGFPKTSAPLEQHSFFILLLISSWWQKVCGGSPKPARHCGRGTARKEGGRGMTCFCLQKRHQEETYVCGSKMIHGRFVAWKPGCIRCTKMKDALGRGRMRKGSRKRFAEGCFASQGFTQEQRTPLACVFYLDE